MEQIIDNTVDALRLGKTILYPTDTIWGIGCDARNSDAVERLYTIKQRDHSKSMLVLVDGCFATSLTRWVEMPERPTTVILPREIWQPLLGEGMVADNIPAADGSLGIRIPKHDFCQKVIHRLGAPLVSTSANFSGNPSPAAYDEIEKALIERLDYCVPPLAKFVSGESKGSRIVKVESDGSVVVIRP